MIWMLAAGAVLAAFAVTAFVLVEKWGRESVRDWTAAKESWERAAANWKRAEVNWQRAAENMERVRELRARREQVRSTER